MGSSHWNIRSKEVAGSHEVYRKTDLKYLLICLYKTKNNNFKIWKILATNSFYDNTWPEMMQAIYSPYLFHIECMLICFAGEILASSNIRCFTRTYWLVIKLMIWHSFVNYWSFWVLKLSDPWVWDKGSISRPPWKLCIWWEAK